MTKPTRVSYEQRQEIRVLTEKAKYGKGGVTVVRFGHSGVESEGTWLGGRRLRVDYDDPDFDEQVY